MKHTVSLISRLMSADGGDRLWLSSFGKAPEEARMKPTNSDDFVPYWSSHLNGAASERIVPSHHGAHQNPQAIAEAKRILILNARD